MSTVAQREHRRAQMRRLRSDPEFMERQRQSNRRARARRRGEIAERQRAYAAANRVKESARRRARKAAEDGRLVKEPCLFCDSPDVVAHHHDYSKALEVTWLCHGHHGLVHRKVGV